MSVSLRGYTLCVSLRTPYLILSGPGTLVDEAFVRSGSNHSVVTCWWAEADRSLSVCAADGGGGSCVGGKPAARKADVFWEADDAMDPSLRVRASEMRGCPGLVSDAARQSASVSAFCRKAFQCSRLAFRMALRRSFRLCQISGGIRTLLAIVSFLRRSEISGVHHALVRGVMVMERAWSVSHSSRSVWKSSTSFWRL